MYCFLGVFILLDVLRTSEISGLVSDINLEKFSVTVSNIYCSFLSSFWFPIKHIATFIVVPQSLHILFCFSSPCSLRFSVLEVSIEIPSSWARGPWVTMSSTPCLGHGFSLHLGRSSSLGGAVMTVGRPCGSGSPPGSQ